MAPPKTYCRRCGTLCSGANRTIRVIFPTPGDSFEYPVCQKCGSEIVLWITTQEAA